MTLSERETRSTGRTSHLMLGASRSCPPRLERTMTVLIDDPIWPAHGRLWGHLVSDTSLDELHAFAREAGIPERGFDHDHYDYPEERREALIAQGALPVTGKELVARLNAAGLRVSQREKRGL